jgi:hypothetical protein
MNFIEAMAIVDRGMKTWSGRPHNKKWWRRIDGTPIPNDLSVCIAEAIVGATEFRKSAIDDLPK